MHHCSAWTVSSSVSFLHTERKSLLQTSTTCPCCSEHWSVEKGMFTRRGTVFFFFNVSVTPPLLLIILLLILTFLCTFCSIAAVLGLGDISHAICMRISSVKQVPWLAANLHHLFSSGAAFNTQSHRSLTSYAILHSLSTEAISCITSNYILHTLSCSNS